MSKAGAQQLLPLPDLRTLTAGLKAVFGMHGSRDEPLVVLERRPNPRESTYPSEIVTCRLDGGSEVSLFCKYGIGYGHRSYGHRWVVYEAVVIAMCCSHYRFQRRSFMAHISRSRAVISGSFSNISANVWA